MTRIFPKKLTRDQISPYQYGQFVEFLANLVRSMHAEKVFDNSFLGLEPYLAWFIKQTDFKENHWYPSGAVHRGEYVLDGESPFNGPVSQKISTMGEDPCDLGISQDGIFIEEGKQYVLSCHLRQEGLQGPLRASLARGREVFSSCEFSNVQGDWSKHIATLTSSGTHTNATLRFEFRAPATCAQE